MKANLSFTSLIKVECKNVNAQTEITCNMNAHNVYKYNSNVQGFDKEVEELYM